MREILFRGKRIDNGEWIEGGYYLEPYSNYAHIVCWNSFGLGFTEYIKVAPETVGQYTGLKDKNGKRIFEGDILEVNNFPYRENSFSNCVVAYGIFREFDRQEMVGFYLYWTSDTEAYRKLPNLKWWLEERGAVCIGNIHDNPEMLEEV